MPSPPPARAAGVGEKLSTTLEMIKFEHSVFALPFALVGGMLAVQGWPTWRQVFWLVVAMVAARNTAMTFNRIADRKIDAANPRTQMRALPAGRLSVPFAIAFTVISCAFLVLAAWQLSPLAFKLSPLCIAVLLFYSYTKRFTALSHAILGVADGLAPIAAWIALRNDVHLSILLVGAAVAFWVGGFDLIYACQDVDFDRSNGLHSIPERYGVAPALYGSIFCHVIMVALLLDVVRLEHLGWFAIGGVAVMAALLVYEHSIVTPSDLSRLNAAFFNVNGYISLIFFLSWGADIVGRRMMGGGIH
jgi:4-hydroxybenzoate polyprenyltransferase